MSEVPRLLRSLGEQCRRGTVGVGELRVGSAIFNHRKRIHDSLFVGLHSPDLVKSPHLCYDTPKARYLRQGSKWMGNLGTHIKECH